MAYRSQLLKLYTLFFYYIPSIIWWMAGHIARSKNGEWFWAVKKAFFVAVVRAMFNEPTPKSMLLEQTSSLVTDHNSQPTMNVVPERMTVPFDNDLSEVVDRVMRDVSDSSTTLTDVCLASCVEGEWVSDKPLAPDSDYGSTGFRKRNGQNVTYLYLHGGQFFLRNPASRRELVHGLVRGTNDRCFSLAYRLSPQNMFPAALLDLAVAYLSLLYPDSQSGSVATSPSTVCICGDSSGGNIALAFLQLILHLQRQDVSKQAHVRWNGGDVILPCPGSIVVHSAYLDLTRSLPSEINNLDLDIIPTPKQAPFPSSSYIQDSIWPAKPARHHVYSPTELLTNPLVSPVAATDWKHCPSKVLFIVGEECLLDGNIIVAQRMAAQGVQVRFDLYQGMPHDFLVLFGRSDLGNRCLASWRDFAQDSVHHSKATLHDKGRALIWGPSSRQLRTMPISELASPIADNDLLTLMQAQIAAWGPPVSRS